MLIDPNILITWGGVSKIYKKNEFIFTEGSNARFYYQILEGSVKMYNINEDGKEYTQGLFHSGESFGEPPLFICEKYPASAISTKTSIILKLSKESLYKILSSYPEIQLNIIELLSKRIFLKANSLRDIINNSPEHRLLCFLRNYKHNHHLTGKFLFPFTRQELANFIGLRVETVIRTLKKMEVEQTIEFHNHKIYF